MGLLDIAPPELETKKFEIRGGTIEVRGLKTRDWVALRRRFPQLRAGINGEVAQGTMDAAEDGLIPAVIAAGLGACGDEETEALVIERLRDSEQIQIFGTIMRLTSPDAEPAGPLQKSPEIEAGPLPEQPPNGKLEEPTTNWQQPSLL